MYKTTIFDVAKMFLSLDSMTHKKLQKLCYYAYSWYLTLYNKRLFENRFEAWIHGPVDPTLYEAYKHYGWQEIPKQELPPGYDPEVYEFVKQVYDAYGHLDGDQLEYLTHQEDPWIIARNGLPECEPSRNPIRDEDIKRYYMKVFENGQNE